MKKNPAKIVIMRTDRIGEVLLSTVLIDGIKKLYPRAEISFVTSEYSKEILKGRDDIAEIITTSTSKRGNWFFKALKLAVILRKKHFDVSIVLNAHKILHLACFLAGIPVRSGYNRKWGVLLNKAIKDEREKGEKHEAEYAMDFVKMFGSLSGLRPNPRLFLNPESINVIEKLFQEKGIDPSRDLIVMHPAGSNPAKIWHKDRYIDLVKKIKSGMNCEIIIIGESSERMLSEEIINRSGVKVFNVTGELNLKELAALLKRAKLFIGNDSGPMHMADALSVPVIAIFGRNIPGVSPRRWGPRGSKHKVFHKDPGCRPCYDRACPYDYKCLKAVTTGEVFEAVRHLLGQ